MKRFIIFLTVIISLLMFACTVERPISTNLTKTTTNTDTTATSSIESTVDSIISTFTTQESSTESTDLSTTQSVNSTTTASTTQTTSDDVTTASTTQTSTSSTIQTTTSSTTHSTTSTQVSTSMSTYPRFQELIFYSVNDFHGGAYLDFESFSRIAGEIKYMKDNYSNIIALTNGDILQGSAISNYYHGRPLIEAMNLASFDGFVIGNHEFDWGIDKIAAYQDGLLENGEADYPFLAANIVYKDSLELLDFTIPYIIKEVEGVRVGVIGVIGDVIGSIAASRVENIIFLDPVNTIRDYTYHLRHNEDVDVVVVYIHSGSKYIKEDIAELSGLERVDAVFFGHTHMQETSSVTREGANLYYAQASANYYSLMVKIQLTYDRELGLVVGGQTQNISSNSLYRQHQEVNTLFDIYKSDNDFQDFVNQVLTFSLSTYNRYDLAPWAASVIKDYLGIDIEAVNTGGFRVNMQQGMVTMGDMVVIYPFDNVIKTSRMTGQQILNFYQEVLYYNSDVVFDNGLTYDGSNLYIDDVLIDMETYYVVGAVDYIFDKEIYDFLEGEDITYTGVFIRDLLVEDLLNSNNSFSPYQGTSFINQEITWYYPSEKRVFT